ncbi:MULTISPECIES: sensor histidine kinase [Cellulomonas]|uniref:Two-component system sensor histidine kinase DesK n=1 Tax=Cellulomonas iranensis TaxID=76862 RepID=A0ABU0GJ67_9CELL|nr:MULTISPECIES: histidine kinase [Cellulomonas]MDQ0425368.1 two-component system sensor histidine kinase DesK [Cellulomonas iranensis]
MSRPRPPGAPVTPDLRAVRGLTAASLGVAVVVAGLMPLLLAVDAPVDARSITLVVTTVLCLVLAFAAIGGTVEVAAGDAPSRTLVTTVVLTVVLACATWGVALVPPFAGWGWAFLVAYAGGAAACVVHGRRRLAVLLGTCVVIGLGGVLSEAASRDAPAAGQVDGALGTAIVVSVVALFVVMPLSIVWVLQVVVRLDDARRLADELAVARERLRFATDLHDLQGHHLHVIALKSELAERLLPDRPADAARELADIREAARTAIEDTRAVVHGYRTVTVDAEVRNAAAVLGSAGIRCATHVDAPGLPADVGGVLAVAVREAATNVLRHSAAQEATIVLVQDQGGGYRLTVTNDRPDPAGEPGTGLVGLRERLATQRGTVETHRDDDAFTLVVTVPPRPVGRPARRTAGAS